ncbi:MAG TPA: NAD(P)-dependent oxidoreductase [Longimicrobiales bacterium]
MLVTGGRGFIGTHLVEQLASAGCEVVSLDTAAHATGESAGVTEIVGDVRDTGVMETLVRRHGIDMIFDLASYTEVGLPRAAYERNVAATRSMVEVVRATGVRKYVFFSTQFVFRRPDRMPVDDDEYWPVDNYGASKVLSEEAIRASLPPEQYLIVRPAYVWGPGLSRFRDGLLYRLARGQLLISSDPTRVRYYGYVRTVADQARALSELSFEDLPHHVFYLSDPAISLRDFCKALTAALGRGHAIPVPSTVIRLLGAIGDGLSRVGLPAPINSMQAREMTVNFPIPIDRTLQMTGCMTNLTSAAEETVAWARQDPDWLSRTRI